MTKIVQIAGGSVGGWLYGLDDEGELWRLLELSEILQRVEEAAFAQLEPGTCMWERVEMFSRKRVAGV